MKGQGGECLSLLFSSSFVPVMGMAHGPALKEGERSKPVLVLDTPLLSLSPFNTSLLRPLNAATLCPAGCRVVCFQCTLTLDSRTVISSAR